MKNFHCGETGLVFKLQSIVKESSIRITRVIEKNEHLVLVRTCRLMGSLPSALSKSSAWVWSPPSLDILSSCFLTEITSSSHDILLGPRLVCKV